LGVRRPGVLFVLGHMRSGSTLLLHLLLTSPEVASVGERNAIYASRADLAHLAIKVRLAHRSLFGSLRYVADQVNHSQFTPVPGVLADPRVRSLFLLRRPEASLSSLLALSREYYNSSWSVARAVDYYVTRMDDLSRIAAALPSAGHAAFIRYETLTQFPQRTLEALRGFLGLAQGFSSHYGTHAFTGRRGDPGPTITAGVVLRKPAVADSEFGEADLLPAVDAYHRCSEALARFAL
jgi:hypothetical protein